MNGNVGLRQWLHVAAAVLADASLLENPLGTVRTLAFLAGLAAKARAVAGAELNVVGVGLLANGAGFHKRRENSPVAQILTEVLPQRETGDASFSSRFKATGFSTYNPGD